MKLYLAAALFSEAEQHFNAETADQLRGKGHEVFVPQEVELNNAGATLDTKAIFRGDVKGLDWCDAVVAVLDGADVDSGTAWECGYAFAKGKPIYGIRTDFRVLERNCPVNIMLFESVAVPLLGTFDGLVAALEA